MLPNITPTPRTWLINALVVPLEGAERHCYYDSKHNRFIEIPTDVFVTLDAEGIGSTRSKPELLVYKDVIERMRAKDGTVHPINKLSLDVRKQVQNKFVKTLGIREEKTIYNIVAAQQPSATLALDNLTSHSKQLSQIEGWWLMKFREELLEEFVTRYVAAYNINLSTVSIR